MAAREDVWAMTRHATPPRLPADEPTARRAAATDRHDVVIVGGGQAGLAIGYLLAGRGLQVKILDAADTPAAAWRARWDSLKLFTPVRYDSLPGRAFPGDPDGYPGRDDVVAYLSDYARDFELPVALDSAVRAVRRGEGGFLIELDDRIYEARQVVVATGPFQVPRVPAVARRLDPDVVQLHSSSYRTPGDVPAGSVLVVGGGNTGFQIAEELSRTHDVHLSIGSRQTPLPQRIAGRDLFRYLQATGLMAKTADSRIGRRLREREALIGSSPRAARRRHGIRLHGRTVEVSGREVAFGDGARLDPSAVVWATGFGLDHSWIDAPVFAPDGRLVHARGVTPVPGLYFLGLPWQHTRGSALLGWVGDDAEYLAGRVSARAPTRRAHETVAAAS
jgi:putative flavoprotein involved in K+ transport